MYQEILDGRDNVCIHTHLKTLIPDKIKYIKKKTLFAQD